VYAQLQKTCVGFRSLAGTNASELKSIVTVFKSHSIQSNPSEVKAAQMPKMENSEFMPLAISEGDPLSMFDPSASFPTILRRAAQAQGQILYVQQDGTEVIQSYGDLLKDAERILGGLRALGSQPLCKVVLQLQHNQDFVTAFWGCLLGGFVPVPIAIAPSYATDNSKTNLLREALQLLEEAIIITDEPLSEAIAAFIETLTLKTVNPVQVITIENLRSSPPDHNGYVGQLDDLALLLFTSGSTGVPKGVMLSVQNLLVSANGMAKANQLSSQDITLNWMPLEHVASLIMFHFTEVYLGCQQIHVPNAAILQDPLKWLDLLERYRVTATWAPNFAYGLVNDQAASIQQGQWDLTSIRWMGNGAEAVVGKTTRRFLELLIPHGLASTAVSPGYGMSETCSGIVHSHQFSLESTTDDDTFVEVGRPIPGVSVRIVNEQNQVVEEGTIGLLQVKGLTVTSGYFKRPDLNQDVFTADGWFSTGDLGFLQAGRLTITGRQKDVIVINGMNYYNHDIEAAVEELEGVAVSYTAACAVRGAGDNTDQIAIFFHPSSFEDDFLTDLSKAIRKKVVSSIGANPAYLIPVAQDEIPKTAIGKIQRSQLSQRFAAGAFEPMLQEMKSLLSRRSVDQRDRPQCELEEQLVTIWQDVLKTPQISIHDNFFELGGNSLQLIQLVHQLQQRLGCQLSAVDLFQHSTLAALADFLSQERSTDTAAQRGQQRAERRRQIRVENADVAVIGMACRFPGANSIAQFWQNLCDGVESISFFTDEELLSSGVDPRLLQHPDYVKASPVLSTDIEAFDAEFFGYSPKEASILDPQQRLLLECAWESLEDAGYNPLTYPGAIGLYAGASMNTYLLNHVYPNRDQLDENDNLQIVTLGSMGGLQMTVANDKDYLTTRVSYKLNLTGPSVNVQTACSTSLVAIHMASQSLLNGECDMALAGGVSVHTPQTVGHLHQAGMILSPDGHCRAFDAGAQGTIFGSGAGVVVLKRLDQAIAAGDHVYAVIKGSAIGNDGGQKVGYLAPNGDGQAVVTAEAIAVAGIAAETIGYVEAHGTGTELGDPVEIAGLMQAFHLSTQKRQFCAIGSVKTNVGHLNIASGIVGFMKAVLVLYHRKIPPSLHFQTPNPQIDFENSPFYVNTALTEWDTNGYPRRAGVNSLGIGGTNAHILLEEAPDAIDNRRQETEDWSHLLTLSAKSETALRELAERYASFLASNPDIPLSDICFTAHVGRSHFEHRLSVVASTHADLQAKLADYALGQTGAGVWYGHISNTASRPRIFIEPGSDWQSILLELAERYVQGATIDWSETEQHSSCRRVALPTYPFQRQRYWLEAKPIQPSQPSKIKNQTTSHPLLGQRLRSASKDILFESQLTLDRLPFLKDHRVYQKPIFPGTAYLEMALAAGAIIAQSDAPMLENVVFQKPLMFSSPDIYTVQCILSQDRNGQTLFQIYSLLEAENEGAETVWTLHCSGAIADLVQNTAPSSVDLVQLQSQFAEERSVQDFYHECRGRGIDYGSGFQAIQQLWGHEGAALGLIQRPDAIAVETATYQMHPILLDACFQVVFAALSPDLQSATYLPVGVERVRVYRQPGQTLWSDVQLRLFSQPNPTIITADLCLFDEAGTLVAQVEGLSAKRRDRTALLDMPDQDWLYEVEWRPQPIAFQSRAISSGHWLIFADQGGIAEQLAILLRSQNQKCILVFAGEEYKQSPEQFQVNPTNRADFQQLLDVISHEPLPLQGVIHLWSLEAADLETAAQQGCRSTLNLIQTLVQADFLTPPRLWLVTQGAQSVGENPHVPGLVQSCLWGMGKVIALEHPELRCRLVDLDPASHTDQAQALLAEISSDHGDNQVAFRDRASANRSVTIRYVARLVRSRFTPSTPTQEASAHQSLHLESPMRGTLDTLEWQPCPRRTPDLGEVEIRVKATGLNFRDVLNALGQYPGDPGPLGLECAGEIVAIGQSVAGFGMGDEVVAIAPASFSQYVTVNAPLVAPKPAHLSCEESATIPVAFLTAHYTLHHLAQISAGKRVLIHAAAGGVGLAAIQLAQQAGADVYATASPSKWDFLKSWGVKYLMNSRTLAFADEVMSLTQGQGVDIVLNCLAGEFIPQSLSVLCHQGCFLEIGKTGTWQSSQVAQIRSDVSYFLIDLVQIAQHQPALLQSMLQHLMQQFQMGQLKPLPQTVFSRQQAIAAFRHMQHAKHIGKIVVSQAPDQKTFQCGSEGAYLITGGLGGLGLQVAQWLVDRGAKQLLLIGRSTPSSSAQMLIRSWEQSGTRISVAQADVSDPQALAQLLEPYLQHYSPTPLRGIIHAAGVLDDGVLMQQRWESFESVMAPKVQGAWNLHVLTQNHPLDFFVLFSSAASLIGSAGQANYSAANAFLDALAHDRRAMKLPGLSINWGAWQDVGLAAQHQVSKTLEAKGLGSISSQQGLAILEELLSQPAAPQVGVLPIHGSQWQSSSAPFFRDFATQSAEDQPLMTNIAFLQELETAGANERRSRLMAHIQSQIVKVLGLSPSLLIDPQQGFSELGIDSLTAIELRNRLQTSLECTLTSTVIFDYSTLTTLTNHLADMIFPEPVDEQPGQNSDIPNPVSVDIQQLSEAEAEALLLSELKRLK
jgi:acyl transferase domain-containing protein/acyl-CoA synthetase (AMP-forming)/AMP-acid ligase II/acyl carrier protein